MSKTEFVMVPRELLDSIALSASRADVTRQLDLNELQRLLAKPSEHQGEPVALPACNAKLGMSHDWDQGYADGWSACLDEIAKLGPLYPHADPGEVERLRQEVSDLIEARDLRVTERLATLDGLRAQLADLKRRHDGLHRDMYTIAAREVPKGCTVADYAAAAIADALSASAEPSAPTEIDHDALVAAVCVLRSQGLGNLSAAVEEARAALERKS